MSTWCYKHNIYSSRLEYMMKKLSAVVIAMSLSLASLEMNASNNLKEEVNRVRDNISDTMKKLFGHKKEQKEQDKSLLEGEVTLLDEVVEDIAQAAEDAGLLEEPAEALAVEEPKIEVVDEVVAS